MPKAEPGSAKAVGNAMKAKGLTKLRFYCQLCAKACRDENGYKCHIESEAHMRQMAALGGSAGKVIDRFSQQFQSEFVQLLSRRFGTRRVRANLVYQEFIQERHHLHMNATRWTSLSSFVKHLGREGIVRAEENEKGWYIEWVDNSPAALARQDALQKMNRAKIDEETRGRKYLQEQIERAKREQADGADDAKPEAGLQRDGDAPIRIGLKPKVEAAAGPSGSAPSETASSPAPAASASASATAASSSTPATTAPGSAPAPLKLGLVSSAKTQPAVRPNAFKAAASASKSASASGSGAGAGRAMTAAERIMAEEQERRQKRESYGPQPSAKRMRM